MSTLDTDITLIGGGFMGYTAALAFAQAGFRVVLLEAKPFDPEQIKHHEGRAIALAYTSCLLYRALGVWSALKQEASPLSEVIISQQGHFGKCRISAAEQGLNSLGYVVPATHLAITLYEAVRHEKNITLQVPVTVESIEVIGDRACVNGSIYSSLVLACDGTDSFARKYFHIQTDEKSYDQQAIVANITLSEPHQGRAYQRFTDQGVLALLPLQGSRMTSVLTVPTQAMEWISLDDEGAYLTHLQGLFGTRHGLFSDLGKRFTYPLIWMEAKEIIAGRTLLLGNAAHTISPVAAQGLNLALRDLALLHELLVDNKSDPGSPELLMRYAQESKNAQRAVLRFTDFLTDWIKPRSLGHLRSAGLFMLDQVGFLKDALAQSLMGFSSHGGRLMREGDHDL